MIPAGVDSPRWWRARCRVALSELLEAGGRLSPLRFRRALRKAPRELRKEARQEKAPTHRLRIWWQVVRAVLGPEWVSLPDRRQLELFR